MNLKINQLTLELKKAVENPYTTIQEIFDISCNIDNEIFSTIHSNKQTDPNIQTNKKIF